MSILRQREASPVSAGLLAWRRAASGPEFLLAHPGGPFWANRDDAAWSIPKGLVEAGEADLAAAMREFREELGLTLDAPGQALTPCRTTSGKRILCWLVEADLDLSAIRSNEVELELPRGSGRRIRFPEVDRAAYFDAEAALRKIHRGQRPILEEAIRRLGQRGG